MKIKFSLIAFIFFNINFALACSCYATENFSKVAPETNLVVLVKIDKFLDHKEIYEKKIPMSMEVEVIEILKGQVSKKKIKIWGDNGVLCRPYLSNFKEGEFYFMALDLGSEQYGHKDEKKSDYSISICGEFWMKADIKKQVAISNFKNNTKSLSFRKVKTYFKSN